MTTIIVIILVCMFLRMRVLTFILLLVALGMLMGCTTTPETLGECEIAPYVEQWETVEDCKMAVQRREDIRFKRQLWEDKKAACKYPNVWEQATSIYSGSCKRLY